MVMIGVMVMAAQVLMGVGRLFFAPWQWMAMLAIPVVMPIAFLVLLKHAVAEEGMVLFQHHMGWQIQDLQDKRTKHREQGNEP